VDGLTLGNVLFVVQQSKSALGGLIISVSRSHTNRHSHTRQDYSETSDQPVAETVTYTTCNKHKRRKPMHSAIFETAMPEIKRRQVYALDRMATGIDRRQKVRN